MESAGTVASRLRARRRGAVGERADQRESGRGRGPGGHPPSLNGQLAEVRIYTLPGCGACTIARRSLKRRGIEFEEISGETTPGFRRMLRDATGSATVPQVVIDGEPIGGADSLLVLDRRGVLLPRLRREPFPVTVVRRRFSPVRLVTGLLARIGGRGHGPWRYHVWALERDGRAIGCLPAGSIEEAAELAEALRDELTADAPSATP